MKIIPVEAQMFHADEQADMTQKSLSLMHSVKFV
jgi:hypothetical protein